MSLEDKLLAIVMTASIVALVLPCDAAASGRTAADTDVDVAVIIEGDEYEGTDDELVAEQAAPVPAASAELCETYAQSAQVKAGGVSISTQGYACWSLAQYELLEALKERDGRIWPFGLVAWNRLFVRAHIFTRGVGAVILGLVGSG